MNAVVVTYSSYLIFIFILIAGLMAPGWLLGRLLGTRGEPSTAFLGSAALLLNLLIALDAIDVALSTTHIAMGLGVVCIILAAAINLTGRTREIAETNPVDFRWQAYHWWLLPAVIGLGAIAAKALGDPLSGLDTFFRWDFLARQMFRQSSLHFYPPITAPDFLHYGWCDGIAPLVSSLYFWAYLALGETAKWATTPIVIGESLLLFQVVYRLAANRGGSAAGFGALALLAINPVLLWGVAMGQETGMTALSCVAMFLYIEKYRAQPTARWLLWAGVAAGTGALAREYGLAFIALGAFSLAWHRVSRRGWFEFLIAAAMVAFPWYLRNWIRTGNPLYSQNLAGLFPVNPVNAEYLQLAHDAIRLPTPFATAAALVGLLVSWMGITLGLGLAGMIKIRHERIPWIVGLVGITTFWFWSSPRTSGGLVYALRVMTPVIGLAAAAGGTLLQSWKSKRFGWLAIVLATLMAIDSAERSRFMPFPSRVVWWKKSPASWLVFSWKSEPWSADPQWAAVASAANAQQVLVSDAYCFTIMTDLGATPVPIFSPNVRFLFEADTLLAPGLARLRREKIRFVLIAKDQVQLPLHPFFKSLLTTRSVMNTPTFLLYDVSPPSSTMSAGQ